MNTVDVDVFPSWANTNNVPRFFYFFSKLEHALKRNKFLQQTKDAKASWHQLADKLGDRFFQSMKEATDARILFNHPAKKQINRNGELDWEDISSPQNAKELLDALQRVRNNLFHGGKYPHAPVEEPSRNDELLRACLFVMESVLKTMPDIRATFNEPAE